MTDSPENTPAGPFAQAFKDLPGQIASSLVCLAVVGAVLWVWNPMGAGPPVRSAAAAGSWDGSAEGSLEIGVSGLSERPGACLVDFRLRNVGGSLAARVGAQIEARAADGSALGMGTVLGSNIRVGGGAVDRTRLVNVSCAEIASIFVSPGSGLAFAPSTETVVPLEM